MKIQMVDLKGQYDRLKPTIDSAISAVINTTTFINGPEVSLFSRELELYNNVAHVIPCANGTDALQLALMALELQSGDEVIVPVFTYVATAEVIALLGLKPVFVDVDPDNFMISPSKVKKSITAKTKAIVPVHLFGQCADMETILAIAKEHQLHVIEDTAQAIGAEYRFSNGTTKKAGTIGDIGTTSFFPSKNLGCYGDGGALFTNNEVIATKLKMIANHGQSIRYYHDVIGINSRLDTLQAAILRVKLLYLDEFNIKRNESASFYDTSLSGFKSIQIPARVSNSTHVFHQYTIKCINFDRDELKSFLQEKGIPAMVYYPVPLHCQKAYQHYKAAEANFPVSEDLSMHVLSLPIHTEQSQEELRFITDSITEFLTNKGLE